MGRSIYVSLKDSIVACVDIDYFFAQAEELRRPELRGKPLVVCVYSGRTPTSGSVASANYVARDFGVRAGMRISDAMRLLRGVDAEFVPMDKAHYEALSRTTFTLLGEVGVTLEVASIDEGFMDLSELVGGDFEAARRLMEDVKSRILNSIGLTVSVGIGPNKLIAKLACERSKPNGLLVVKPSEVNDFLKGMPVDELPYVGKKLSHELARLGVRTVDELARVDPQVLIGRFGRSVGLYLHLASRGEHREGVEPRIGRSEIGRIVTLKEDTDDVDLIISQLRGPLEDLQRRLASMNLAHRGIAAIAITHDMRTVVRSKVLQRPNQQIDAMLTILRPLFAELTSSLGGVKVRRAGVKLFRLHSLEGQTRLLEFEKG